MSLPGLAQERDQLVDAPLVFRTLSMTCPHCGLFARERVREIGDVQVLGPCRGCGMSRGARTKIEVVQ